MKIYYFVVVVVLFIQPMAYKTKRIKNINMNTKEKCKNIKCPPIDEPVCVKIKNKNMNEVYVMAVNKCEIKYANCHEDLDAVIVPMQNCLHEVKNYQNTTGKRYRRQIDENSKGSPKDSEDDKGGTDVENEGNAALNDEDEDNEKEDNKGMTDVDNEGNVVLNGEIEDNENKDGTGDKGGTDDDNEGNVALNDENEDNEYKDDKGRTDGENEGNIALNGENEDIENEDYDLLKGQSEENKGRSKENGKTLNDENDNQSEVANNYEGSEKLKEKVSNDDKIDENNSKSGDENNIQKLIAVDNVGADYDQHDEVVDLDESYKKCPTVCPSRDVMVCAKCRHNIYRTFLSQCHLKMFACKHIEEKLRLVKREPCVQSAPFIAKFKETKGRVPESGEPDEVHKFIFCRNKKLLDEDDTRCRFREKNK